MQFTQVLYFSTILRYLNSVFPLSATLCPLCFNFSYHCSYFADFDYYVLNGYYVWYVMGGTLSESTKCGRDTELGCCARAKVVCFWINWFLADWTQKAKTCWISALRSSRANNLPIPTAQYIYFLWRLMEVWWDTSLFCNLCRWMCSLTQLHWRVRRSQISLRVGLSGYREAFFSTAVNSCT